MDTDGDGLNDGEETGPVILAGKAYSMKTDPSKRDTDGDGYNDKEDLIQIHRNLPLIPA
ncbi:MAG: hypothetical protein M0Z31_05100 [Clostridia bacterium]|nr:hypothetical protein [Clostridia bacterium]